VNLKSGKGSPAAPLLERVFEMIWPVQQENTTYAGGSPAIQDNRMARFVKRVLLKRNVVQSVMCNSTQRPRLKEHLHQFESDTTRRRKW
jgi:hypothetical protein